LKITGTDLPDNISKLQSMSFAKSNCKPIPTDSATGALSGTSIECTLDRNPTCGSYVPAVTTPKGNIPIADSVKAKDIACTMSAASPLKDVNLLGKDKITFTGTNFPHELKDNVFDITFTNGLKTKCDAISTKTTELVCLTNKFDTKLDIDKPY